MKAKFLILNFLLLNINLFGQIKQELYYDISCGLMNHDDASKKEPQIPYKKQVVNAEIQQDKYSKNSINNPNLQPLFPYLNSAKIIPYVIKYEESFKLEIKITDSNINGVQIQGDLGSLPLEHGGISSQFLELFDDGTNGDILANDGIFSLDNLKLSSSYFSGRDLSFTHSAFCRFIKMKYHFSNNSEVILSEDLALAIRYIPISSIIEQVLQINNSVQYSSNMVNLVYDNQGSSFLPYMQLGAMPDIANFIKNNYFSNFPDKDFLAFSTTYNTAMAQSAAEFRIISWTNISNVRYNRSNFNSSAYWGSLGKLKGNLIFYFTVDGSFSLFNHELLHYWGIKLNPNLNLNYIDDHWVGGVEFIDGGSGFGSGGQGSLITDLNNNQYHLKYGSSYFNTLELYLMGLIDINEVTFPIRSLINPMYVGYQNGGLLFTANGINSVTKIDFLTSMGGERTPNVLSSQKKFDIGNIVISDRPLTAIEMTYFNLNSKAHESKLLDYNFADKGPNFYHATNGKGEVSTKVFSPCDFYSIKSGNWNDPNLWSCGRVPTSNDNVVVSPNNLINIPTGVYEVKSVTYIGGTINLETGAELKIVGNQP